LGDAVDCKLGVCIIDGKCFSRTFDYCQSVKGSYGGDGTLCPTGACMIPQNQAKDGDKKSVTMGPRCRQETEEACSRDGKYLGDGVECPFVPPPDP